MMIDKIVVVIVVLMIADCCLGGRGGVSVGNFFDWKACGCCGALVEHVYVLLLY